MDKELAPALSSFSNIQRRLEKSESDCASLRTEKTKLLNDIHLAKDESNKRLVQIEALEVEKSNALQAQATSDSELFSKFLPQLNSIVTRMTPSYALESSKLKELEKKHQSLSECSSAYVLDNTIANKEALRKLLAPYEISRDTLLGSKRPLSKSLQPSTTEPLPKKPKTTQQSSSADPPLMELNTTTKVSVQKPVRSASSVPVLSSSQKISKSSSDAPILPGIFNLV